MMLGRWIPWKPLENMNGKYYIKSYNSSFDGVKIVLSKCKPEENVELHVTFGSAREIFRIKNELYTGKLCVYLWETHKDVDMSGPLFIVEDSEYLRSLSDEADGLLYELKYKHYYIDDKEWAIDIASQQQPQVELFINGKLIERSKFKWH